MKKSLVDSNPHLKDAAKRAKALARNIESSSAIEGIRVKRDSSTGHFENEPKEVTTPAEPEKKPE